MLTITEIAVTTAIWTLTAAGGFLGTRAMVRKNRLQRKIQQNDAVHESDNKN